MKKLGLFIYLVFWITTVKAQQIENTPYSKKFKSKLNNFNERVLSGDSTVYLEYADFLYSLNQRESAYQLYQKAYVANQKFKPEQLKKYAELGIAELGVSPVFNISKYFKEQTDKMYECSTVTFNSLQEDLLPFYRDGKVLFASSRWDSTNRQAKTYDLTGLPFLNFYLFDTLGVPHPLYGFPPTINSDLHDGPLALTSDSSLLVTTKTRTVENQKGEQQMFLQYYQKINGNWTKPKNFHFNSLKYSTQHPCFDSSGQYLYFSSDMPNGKGGFDIYRVRWLKNDWGKLEKLPSGINSEYDEVFPSFSPENIFYYATNHPENYGGLDIIEFKDGERIMLPPPINSIYDDFCVSWVNNQTGYFTSNRNGLKYNDDLYLFNKIKRENKARFQLRISASDKDNDELRDIQIVLKNLKSGDSITYTKYTDVIELGSFILPFPEWRIQIKSKGYYDVIQGLTFDSLQSFRISNIYLTKKKPILSSSGYLTIFFQNGEPGKDVRLGDTSIDYARFFKGYIKGKHVYYAKSASSKSELDSLFADIEKGMHDLELFPAKLDSTLQSGRRIKVYMAMYTSNTGYEGLNKMLALKRGAVLKNYILNWNGGALKKYVDSGQLTVSAEYFPVVEAKKGKINKKNAGPEVTMFGVLASRNRRVNVVWETLADK